MNLCLILGRSPHSSISSATTSPGQLIRPPLSSSRPPGMFLLQTMCISYSKLCSISLNTRPRGGLGPLSFSPLILNARPATSCITSYLAPPMMYYFCQFPCALYVLLATICSQDNGSSWHRGIRLPGLCRGSLDFLKSCTPFAHSGSTAIGMVMQSILNAPLSNSPYLQPSFVGIISGNPLLCTPLQGQLHFCHYGQWDTLRKLFEN